MLIVMVLVSVLTLALNHGVAASAGCRPNITVISNGNSGPGTLRQAIVDVCEGGVIDFNLPLPNTITLTSGELLVDKAMTINGPGADLLAISANHNGRALQNQAAGLYLSGLTIRDGDSIAGGAGMGVLNLGVMTINDSVIRDNQIDNILGGPSLGAGIANIGGTLAINNSAISQNKVFGIGGVGGGGVTNMYGGGTTITNSTISDNFSHGAGGGIFNWIGTVTMNYSTVVNNDGQYGDGIGTELLSLVVLRNSIVANGTTNCDGSGQFVSLGHNLSNTDDCNLVGLGDLPNTDPLLGPLQDNGGTTPTHALLAGSSAIDAAALDCPATDQRGVARPQGPRCDIGAFEAVYETMALAHQYWMNDGSSGSGVFSLLTDGSFTDDVGGTGAWSFLPTPPRVLLQYDAGFACDALLTGKFLTDSQVQGLRLCQDGSGIRGVWQAAPGTGQ